MVEQWRRGQSITRWPGHASCSPVEMTGREPPLFHHRNTYQEIPHRPLYAAVSTSAENFVTDAYGGVS